MSPLPDKRRLVEIAAKGVHVALREVRMAPEQCASRRLARQARSIGVPARAEPRVAILTPRDWAVHVQWDAMIAQALRLRGARVDFITCGGGLEICDRTNTWEGPPMPCRSCRKYVDASLSAHGFYAEKISDGWKEEARDPGQWPELDALPLDDLLHVEFEGLSLGDLIDIPVKWFLMNASLSSDPIGPITVRRFLRSARRVAVGLTAALDRLSPDVVVLLNGTFLFEAIAWALCDKRQIDVVSYERGMIKDTLIFRRGVPVTRLDITDLWSLVASTPLTPSEEGALDAYLADREVGRRSIDQYWTHVDFEAPRRTTNGKLVSLFTNLTWDSAIIGREIAFPTIQDWILAAVDAFTARPEHQLVIRIHPAETRLPGKQTREPLRLFLRERYPQLPPNVGIIGADDSRSSYSLMADSDAGLVLTSTSGLELALLGKPVVVAGATHYRGKGFTIDVSSPAEFTRAIDDVLSDSTAFLPNTTLARRYAHLFFIRSALASPGVEEHRLGLAKLTVADLYDLSPGKSEAVDRICACILDGDEFAFGASTG